VPLSRFGFRPTERFLYEYDFSAGWQIEVRVEGVIQAAARENHRIPVCIAGRHAGPPDGCGGPQAYAERRRDAVGWEMADDVDAVVAVLRRVSDGDRTVLDDPEERSDFERAVSRLKAREPFLAEGFSPASTNAGLRQAFTVARGSR
jgi:Plasmid pRiA4b ORF-3-like protein